MNIKKEYRILAGAIMISLAIVLLPYLFLGKDFIVGYDVRNQHIPLYTELRNILYSGELPFWSHNLFLGTDFWSSKTFYMLGDVFSLITVALPGLEVVDAMLVAQIVRFVFSITVTYLLLRKIRISCIPAIAGAISYSLSSWLLLFYGMPTFASALSIFPLLILGIELYIRENKWLTVVISSFLLASANYYLFWSISVFLIIYWPARYLLSNSLRLKDAAIATVKLVFYYGLGVALSAPLLLPTVLFMRQNPRVGTIELSLTHSLSVYLDLFIKTVSSGIYANKELESAFATGSYRLDQIGLFTTSFAIIAVPQFLAMIDKRKKLIISLAALAFSLILLAPLGGSLMHGLSESSFRWVFTISLMIVITTAYVLDHSDMISKKILIATLVVVFTLLAIIVCQYRVYEYRVQLSMIVVSAILMIVYALTCSNSVLTSLIIILEVSALGLTNNLLVPAAYVSNYQYEGIDKNFFKDLDDSEYYRIYIDTEYQDIDYKKDFTYNTNLIFGYKGVAGYDSTYQPSVSSLLRNFDEDFWWFRLSTHNLLDVLSTKYIIVANEWEADYYNATVIKKIGGSDYYLCLNNSYKPFGYTNNNVISLSEFNEFDYIWDKDLLIRDNLVVDDYYISTYGLNNLDKTLSHHITDLSYRNNSMDFRIETTADELLYLSIAYDRGWKVYVDGSRIETFPVNCGLTGMIIPGGNHEVHMTFTPKGLIEGTAVSAFALVVIVMMSIKQKRGNKCYL